MSRKKFYEIIVNMVMISISFAFLFPVFYTVLISFHSPGTGLLGLFPDVWDFSNYSMLAAYGKFPRYILNSLINALGGAFISVSFATAAAYALARLNFKGKKIFMGLIYLFMMLPLLTNLIPLYKISSDLGLLNTYPLMLTIFGAYGLPLAIFIIKGFFESIPVALEEAAQIDGATPSQALWHVVVPLTLPGVIAAFLINFVYSWNNFFTPFIMITKTSMNMATVGLYDFKSTLEHESAELLATACVVVMVPALILFLSTRKYFMKGMIEGAIKG